MKTKFLFPTIAIGLIALSVAEAAPRKLGDEKGGEKAGNGGKVVICPTAKGETYEILDFQRAKTEYGLEPIDSVKGSDEKEMAAALIERIRGFNPSRADRYLEHLERFASEAKFLPDAEFPRSDDTTEAAYCKGGRIVQVITQRVPKTSFEKRYLVNLDYWQQLPKLQRAFLYTHEVALRETLDYGYESADGASMMNAILMAKDLSTFSRAQIEELYLATGLLYIAFDLYRKPPTLSANIAAVADFKANPFSSRFKVPYASLDFLDTDATDDHFAFPLLGSFYIEREREKPSPAGRRYGGDDDSIENYLAAIEQSAAGKGAFEFTVVNGSKGFLAHDFTALDRSGRNPKSAW